jgi:two-component system, LytTR family, response regulator
MKIFKAIIVDDEINGRLNLASMLKNNREIKVIGEASNVIEAKELILSKKPDVVFLDILMPELNGFNLLDLFPDRNFAVIFVSASVDFGIRALKSGVLDYVLKPISTEELQVALNKIPLYFEKQALEKVSSRNQEIKKIALSHSTGFVVEDIQDIIRLEADDNYTRVFLNNGKSYLISRPLKDFELCLPSDIFLRVHKSFMLNLHHIKDYSNTDGGIVTLSDGYKTPVSKRKNPEFFNALKKYSLMFRS